MIDAIGGVRSKATLFCNILYLHTIKMTVTIMSKACAIWDVNYKPVYKEYRVIRWRVIELIHSKLNNVSVESYVAREDHYHSYYHNGSHACIFKP